MGTELRGPFWRRPSSLSRLPRPRTVAATLAGLWGFAFADPVFGLLGQEPPFFTTHGVGGGLILLWLVLTAALPPLLLTLALVALRGVNRRAAAIGFVGLVGVLFALILIPRIDEGFPLHPPLFLIFGVVTALAFGLMFTVKPLVRRLLAATWFSPLVFGVVFVAMSPASALVMPANPPDAPPVAAPRQLVVLVLDEFPVASLLNESLQIDRDRFPGFARLADLSTWYRNTTTPSVRTAHAVSSLLTGLEPATPSGLKPDRALLKRNLFSMLADTHDLQSTEPHVRLCEFRGCEHLVEPANFELYRHTGLAALREWFPERWAKERFAFLEADWGFVDRARGVQMARLREPLAGAARAQASEPGVWFTHVFLPHRPWEWLPGGVIYPAGIDRPQGSQPGDGHSYWSDDPRVVDFMRQRLILQVQALDETIGELAAALADGTIARDAMVIIAADHGISFKQGAIARAWELAPDQYADIARVPLFVRYPGQTAGDVNDRAASLIDVLPTVAHVMEAQLPESWEMDGSSLAAPRWGSYEQFIFDDANRLVLPTPLDLSPAIQQYRALAGGTSDLYAHGPLGSLVRRPWGDLPLGPARRGAELVDSENYDSVEFDGLVPAMVEVELDGPVPGSWAVVAINGTVAGSGPVYQYEGVWRIAAMVDPAYFRVGANDVKVAVADTAEDQLIPLTLS
ncbi:MAG: sulfatase-like hydrolase/transferase [Actinobacteria bacterium]|nr:sulfatase-like hydrolase/transferase [Actinomycetota bacterium]